jgi:hypothetical protein
MVANAIPPEQTEEGTERHHVYHAEAHVLEGHLDHPIKQPFRHGRAVLENSRREDHINESVKETSLEGLISFKAGFTRVSGSQLKKKKDLWGNDHSGWVTLSTSVVEGLNVLEVITADRMVAQVSTEHPLEEGEVPKVTFLGTRFDNLRVSGFPVEFDLDLGICGTKPPDDRPYLYDSGFLDRVEAQLDDVKTQLADAFAAEGVPEPLERRYNVEIERIKNLKKNADARAKNDQDGYPKLKCSLVKKIGKIPISGVKTFGNVIFIPDFGTVALADVEVGIEARHYDFPDRKRNGGPVEPSNSNYFTLRMLDMRLGCIGGGSLNGPTVTSNGSGSPGHK